MVLDALAWTMLELAGAVVGLLPSLPIPEFLEPDGSLATMWADAVVYLESFDNWLPFEAFAVVVPALLTTLGLTMAYRAVLWSIDMVKKIPFL